MQISTAPHVPGQEPPSRPRKGVRGLRGVSLQLRLTLVFTAFLALVLIVVAVVVYGLTQRSILETVASRAEQEYSNALEAMRQNPALDSSTRGGWVQNLSGDTQLFVNIYLPEPQLSARSTPFFAFERVPQMYVVKDAGGEALSEYLGDADLQRLLSGEPLSQVVRDVRGRTWYVEGRLERFNLSNLEVPAAMMVALPVSTDTLSQLRINLIQTIVVAFVGFALGVWFLAQRVLAPLKQVTQAASRISSHDLSQRVPLSLIHI